MMGPELLKASGAALAMRSGTLCAQSWLPTPEKKIQVKEKQERKVLEKCLGQKLNTLLDTAWARMEKGPGRKKDNPYIISSN